MSAAAAICRRVSENYRHATLLAATRTAAILSDRNFGNKHSYRWRPRHFIILIGGLNLKGIKCVRFNAFHCGAEICMKARLNVEY